MANRWETVETVTDFIFLGSKITVDSDYNHEFKRHLLLGRKPMTNLDSILKSRDITLLTKVHIVKGMVFPVVMYGPWTRMSTEDLMLLNVVLEKTLESPLDSKEINPANPKRFQSWIFIARTDAEAEGTMLWPPDSKSWLTGKDPHGGKDWRQEEKGSTEDEICGWHHSLNEHEFEQTPGAGEAQGSLACCSPWVTKSWTWLSDCTTINKGNSMKREGLNENSVYSVQFFS